MEEIQTATAGLLEVRTSGAIEERTGTIVIDFGSHASEVVVDLNGETLRAASAVDLAGALQVQRTTEAARPVSIPYEVGVEGSRITIRQQGAASLAGPGVYLIGAEAQAAVEKASRIIDSAAVTWPAALDAHALDRWDMGGLRAGSRWDGPLVVSMPRTGSTLMGVLLLFCRDERAGSGFRFDRYLHEPVAPVFWRGEGVESIGEFLNPPLSNRDVVQESAYQFADPRIARWFLTQARRPVIFTMRHPQLAWPSRWRTMLAQMLDADPAGAMADAFGEAIGADDFSGLGTFLTESVRPADNGFYAFMALLATCVADGIEFVIVDNTRFRTRPEATMRELCRRLDIEFDEGLTNWSDLGAVRPRIMMTQLARGDEYPWYYAETLSSAGGIRPETRSLLDPSRFPDRLRGLSDQYLTIDEAATWHQLLLARPETLL